MPLSLCSTSELIEELINRSSFVGAVVYSADEQRNAGQRHSHFNVAVATNICDTSQLLNVLETTVSDLKFGNIVETNNPSEDQE